MLPAVLIACSLAASPVQVTTSATDEALIRQLIDAMKDADPDVRGNLANALAKIGPASVEPLTTALKDAVAERRAAAAYTLALIGSPSRTALPTLLDLLKDNDVDVRRQASYAISKIVPTGGGGR
ncbi:HEAT repeat domain-containing protein [Limnoglobus roseus]|uniref:HEAT repeat domain-containing protein n=1 Tax=Limnoglobus roseus TaxID=2598579 RepID=A0A5C1A7E8_9BACT|nr:HEAT repeat domain-containing protein [Limnoglobus roseus]QEL13906.1 HEAT repeat domain-containing protein [Limnoglobus roseus]